MPKVDNVKKKPILRRAALWCIKKIAKLIWKFKKTSIVLIGVLVLITGFSANILYKEHVAINACQKLYDIKIDNFSNLTGINDLNVDFQQSPTISKAKNIYSLEWNKTINIGGQQDSFRCQYNFATSKALDRSDDVKAS